MLVAFSLKPKHSVDIMLTAMPHCVDTLTHGISGLECALKHICLGHLECLARNCLGSVEDGQSHILSSLDW